MPATLPRPWTLTRYLIEERRRFPQASGTLNALVLDISLACKATGRIVAVGATGDPFQHTATPVECLANVQRDLARQVGELSQEIFLRTNEWNGHLAGMACGDTAGPRQIPAEYLRGHYLLLVEPLDGAGNIDVNVSLGSIFSILRAPQEVIESGRDVTEADFLQTGVTQVAAGYAIYGPATMLVLSVGNGVVGFTLNTDFGEFVLTHPAIQVPADTQEFAINSSNSRFWEPPVKRYVDECLAGRTGARGKDFSMRWIACLVAEAHRILMRGGVCLFPRDSKDPASPAQLRLLHAANPIGFILEQAGGRASTGRSPVLEVVPASLEQRVGLVFGSRNEVERIERYHRDPATREHGAPLFAERSLFRD